MSLASASDSGNCHVVESPPSPGIHAKSSPTKTILMNMRSQFTKTSILVLDIDGTLSDSIPIHQEVFAGAIQALGFTKLDTNWGVYSQHTDIGIVEEAVARENELSAKKHDLSAFEADLTDRFFSLLKFKKIEEIKGAKAFVEAAYRSEWGVVFATGGIRGVSGEKLKAIGISYDDEMLITSSEWANRTQLVAAAIAKAKEYYDVPNPKSVLSLGDGRWDWEVANQLNIRFLGVGTSSSADILKDLGARVIPDLSNAESILACPNH